MELVGGGVGGGHMGVRVGKPPGPGPDSATDSIYDAGQLSYCPSGPQFISLQNERFALGDNGLAIKIYNDR